MEVLDGEKLFDKLHRINYLMAETDALYHQASLKLGISDSAMRVLYAIYDSGESCSPSSIYKASGVSKQTINSVVRKLEKYADSLRKQVEKL
ncbi:helix-turn-helix domain-containing protein [Roseburia hominis]